MDYSWYSRLLVHKYWLVIALVFFFSLSCITVPLVTDKLPNFTDPQAGFEARGTEIAQRLRAWENLLEANEELTSNPLEYYYFLQDFQHQKTTTHRSKPKHQKNKPKKKHKKKHREHNDVPDDPVRIKRSENVPREPQSGFFCNDPISEYARVVISSKSGEEDLWSLEGMRAQCLIDNVLRTSTHFSSLCELENLDEGSTCCPSWTPANYVAFMSDRAVCEDITEEDLTQVKRILIKCHELYRKGDLTADCVDNFTCKLRVPAVCYRHGNAVYVMLHYLLDIDFFPKDKNRTDTRLSSVMMMLPIAASTAALQYYQDLNIDNLIHTKFQVVAMQFGLKNLVFNQLLISDSVFLLFGFVFVTICIWAYTSSILITLSTIFVIVSSLAISYSFYRLVLRIELFPFMNLLAVVVAVGIGSDDAFIFCKVWECAKREAREIDAEASLIRLTHETLRHAVPAMFVSTLTTAVAFFASIVSNVTAINCFSIFSGTTVIVNFLLMITWLPACVLATERLRCDLPMQKPLQEFLDSLQQSVDQLCRVFTKTLAQAVIELRLLWLVLFSGLSIAACYVVFYQPGLQLPNSPVFQLLRSEHPFELYELQYAQRFYFEQPKLDNLEQVLSMHFVWGVLPVDNGDHLNPASRGSLVLDPSFNVTARESQMWLHRFCSQLRLQPFYRSTLGPLLPNCLIETMQPWMDRPCQDPVEPQIDRSPCCKSNAFPYEPSVLHECAAVAIAEMYLTPSNFWDSRTTAGFKFQRINRTSEKIVPEIRAFVVEYASNVTFSFSFAEMEEFYRTVDTWMRKQLESAPPGLKNGWFISNFEFYELQRTLYEGTVWSVVVSMGLAFSVLGLMTLNPFISLYAILSVAAAIVVTVAVLVIIGWRLDVMENIAVSTAIGLTVDFSLHYGVCYRSSTAQHRKQRVKAALDKMAGPTLMAALTTAAAGALVMPSHVLPYIHIGLFLIIVMMTSWLYATLLLCPMLAAAGPSARYAQFKIFWNRKSLDQNPDEQIEIELQPIRASTSS